MVLNSQDHQLALLNDDPENLMWESNFFSNHNCLFYGCSPIESIVNKKTGIEESFPSQVKSNTGDSRGFLSRQGGSSEDSG